MKKRFQRTLFIFRRDFRLEDNTGLIFALQQSEEVIPAFIFTPEQIKDNPYKSEHCLRFMIESLEDLEEQLHEKGGRLYYFEGRPDEVVAKCIAHLKIDALVVNRDYTPYSIKRDEMLEHLSDKANIEFVSFHDALLHPPEDTLKKDGKPYVVFTPYFRNATTLAIAPPQKNTMKNYFKEEIPFAKKPSFHFSVTNGLKGGRKEALKILEKLKHSIGPTNLSPYLKFTVCSPREVYAACGSNQELVRSLHWRDFFTTISFFFPHVFGGAFHKDMNRIKWSYNQKNFERWCEGKTGFPLVDASMRDMNQTGCMPNRMRMVAASFLVKDLHIDWQWGEKYFARHLLDYDPALNNGNWQWVASTGCDAQPYFRIFNPWNQQKKFDPECTYIKEWVPELRGLSPSMIHKWYDEKYHILCKDYPPPMVDHQEEAVLAYNQIVEL